MHKMTRFAYTIFCKDVRTEINNKRFYIGVYDGNIDLLGKDEAILPNLSITISLCTTIDDKYKKAEYVVEINGMDALRISPTMPRNREIARDAIRMTSKVNLEIGNIKLIADTKIITYVIVDDERIEGDRIHIIKGKPEENAPIEISQP